MRSLYDSTLYISGGNDITQESLSSKGPWDLATKLLRLKLNSDFQKNNFYRDDSVELLIFSNLSISPFKTVKMFYGSVDCSDVTELAGICFQDEKLLKCDSFIEGRQICPVTLTK